MRGTRPRHRAVQLDLFSPVDDRGNLISDSNGIPRLLDSPGRADHSCLTPQALMCGTRFIETGTPWERPD